MIDNIERWFSGKSAEGAVAALNLLARSEAEGYWLPGASRKVRSLFSKQNRAAKLAKAIEATTGASDYSHPLHLGCSEMRYGAFKNARRVLASLPSRLAIDDTHASALATIRDWCEDWAPIADAIALLDSRRPKPVIVLGTLSPSVVAHLGAAVGLDLATVCVAPMRGEWREVERPIRGARPLRTEKVTVWHVEILWPSGTVHGASRYGTSAAGNAQCEACGHAIRDPYNWLPLLAFTHQVRYEFGQGVPRASQPCSLWVGKDCARKLLGSDLVMTGEAVYARATGIAPSPGPAEVKP